MSEIKTTYTLTDIRNYTADISREMIVKMLNTAYKGSWMNYTEYKLRDRLEEEVEELIEELVVTDEEDYARIAAEAVDVANLAMMIHSWALNKQRLRDGTTSCMQQVTA